MALRPLFPSDKPPAPEPEESSRSTGNRDVLPAAIAQSRTILVNSLDNGFRFLSLVAGLSTVAILFSGVKVINPQEVAIIKRFGKIVGQNRSEQVHGPGLLLAFPYLIDEVIRVPVKQVQELQVSTFSASPISIEPTIAARPLDQLASVVATPSPLDSNMADGLPTPIPTATVTPTPEPSPTPTDSTLDPSQTGYIVTGNKNVVHTIVLVKYTISDPIDYAIYTSDPQVVVNDAVSEALTQVIGVTGVDAVLTNGKNRIIQLAMAKAQKRLDEVNTGVLLGALEIKEMRPPDALKADFDAVTTAYVGMQTALQAARTYRAATVPAAQAQRDTQISSAKAFAASRLAFANGDTSLFRNVIAQYKANPSVVKERLYREAMDNVLSRVGSKVLVPENQSPPRIYLPAKTTPNAVPTVTPTALPSPTPIPGTEPTPTPTATMGP